MRRVLRSTVSDELRPALDAALEAALDIDEISRKIPSGAEGLAKLTKELDAHAFQGVNDVPLGEALKRAGHTGIQTVHDVHALTRSHIAELRTIEIFRVGNFDYFREFCLTLNKILLESWHEEDHFRSLA